MKREKRNYIVIMVCDDDAFALRRPPARAILINLLVYSGARSQFDSDYGLLAITADASACA